MAKKADNPPQTISDHFASLKDPRTPDKTEHQLIDIITIAICAVICGDCHAIALSEQWHYALARLCKLLKCNYSPPSWDGSWCLYVIERKGQKGSSLPLTFVAGIGQRKT